ncbi:LacI family DNA-binding transcriptional regulator [Clostridium formicaceticum]|uniref:Catabolite control protein A n=1 Tax=Clostridium formicaceticum TaxID=1497 RepID=A0AAC9WHE3_9CLOT|nr:LacI family DNA-binding transcriptional regulator [Clostridium formicaceticum]AOY74496.1 hypothetical protein BJL90_00120 [Clostridium formicaceticum]ARE88846.1 Catabolite control protein A [Clostridium formicaceticum]
MAITIKDIARMAKVSTATVSRVLNNPDKVSEEKKELVNKIMYEMNYQPNALARGLIRNQTKTVGVIIPDINNLFYPAVVRGIEDVFEINDYNVFLCNTDQDIEKEKKYMNTLLEKRVDGIILMGTRPVDPCKSNHIGRISSKIPLLMVNDYVLGAGVYAVLTDEVEGAYKAVKYLIDLGHRRIAYITGDGSYTTYQNKQKGYEIALQEHDIAMNKDFIIHNLPYPEGGKRAALQLLSKKEERPTAIFAGSDQIAMGVMKAAYEIGLKIPEDISIVGYANIPISGDLYPGLTTVDQYPYETGKLSAEILTKIINGEQIHQKKFIMEPQLLVRQSCSALV